MTAATAAIYIRLSKETEATTSPERQEEACRSLAASRGWDVVAVHSDIDVSATAYHRRAGWDAALSAARAKDVDHLIVWKVDRAARSVRHLADIVHELDGLGVSLTSATEPFDLSTPMGRAMVQMIGVFAELEAATIASRVKSAQDYLASVGRWRGGRRPFGHRPVAAPDGRGFVLDVDETEADEVRRMASALLDGTPYGDIARDLQDRQVPTVLGSDWSVPTVRRILTSRRLIGEADDGSGEAVIGDDGMPMDYPGPAILDRETWDRVQAEVERRARPLGPRKKAGRRLLSEVLLCAGCRVPMTVSKSHGVPAYRCSSYSRAGVNGTECEAPTSTAAEPLEEHVTDAFLEDFGALPEVRLIEPTGDDYAEERERLRDALDDLDVQRFETGRLDAERWATLRDRVQERIDKLPAPSTGEPELVRTGRTFGEAWEDATDPERRDMLAQAIGELAVARGGRGSSSTLDERLTLRWAS